MLMVTSAVIPVLKHFNLSPILGFLLMGTILGPSCLGCIHDVHTIDALGELGIVFFLFEMGLELSITRLNALKKDVFGLGTCQFLLTAALGSGASMACGLPTPAAVTIGGSLALSSSAFVLQLLKDKNQMGTRHGKASFGILLLQDLAVVPLLVVVELLAKGGTGLGHALCIAGTHWNHYKCHICITGGANEVGGYNRVTQRMPIFFLRSSILFTQRVKILFLLVSYLTPHNLLTSICSCEGLGDPISDGIHRQEALKPYLLLCGEEQES
jgi:Sodium/hydrogen exchanger family